MKKISALIFSVCALTSPLLSSNMDWSFPPTTISTATLTSSDPHISIDSVGNLFTIWVENSFVKAKVRQINGGWSSTVTLSGINASSPNIVTDLNGNTSAIWIEGETVKAATKKINNVWSSASTLSLSGASSPCLAVDSAGNVVAMWVRGHNIESSTKLFGSSWDAPVTITSSSAANPQVAIGGSGSSIHVTAVWQGLSGSTHVVYSASKLISGLWSAEHIISDTTTNAGYPHVAVDTQGKAAAIWYAFDVMDSIYSNVIVQAASNKASGSWSMPINLSAPGIRNPATLVARIGFDAMGNTAAIWNTSFDDETFTIQSSTLPVRGTWTSPATIVNDNLYAYAMDMSVNSLGDALALYMFYNGNNLLIQSAETDIIGFQPNDWSVPNNISTGGQNAFPHVASTLTGNVIHAGGIWVDSKNGHNIIQASTGSRTVLLPPSNLSVIQGINNFNVFTEYYNTLTWNPSSDPKVSGYVIFRNGVLLDQVNATTLQIVDHNRTENGSAVYGVAAFNNDGSQSKIIHVSFP